ncbi:RNA polymerase sigma-70 factor [Sunxiuqinia indica]|uniref:RNA polymerase sigma-70 factor n=1 Tax=Sunxiuqinia indica TaxID=2692584 RepID=UPI001359424C|nr:RNA polymerase sigma-70 factor [Sunxiuqinia indica]
MSGVNLEIVNLRNGVKETYRHLYHQYYSMLFNLAYQYLDDGDDAKEIVQNAFLKLWEIKGQLKDNSNLKNYLYTLVKNGCLNQIKRNQIVNNHNNNIKHRELELQYESLSRMSFDYMEIEELKTKIEEAVSNLPEHCRKVFCMSRYEGFKNTEIAEKLNISEKTVEAHMTKALKSLRVALKDYLPLLISILFQ